MRGSRNSSKRAFVRPRAFHWMQVMLGMAGFVLFSFVGWAGCSGGCSGGCSRGCLLEVASSSLDL